jgi:hypothetical protein
LIGKYTFPEQNAALVGTSAIATAPRYLLFVLGKTALWSSPIVTGIVCVAVIRHRGFRFIRTGIASYRPSLVLLLLIAVVLAFLLFCVPDDTRQNQRFVLLPVLGVCVLAGFSLASLYGTIHLSHALKWLVIGSLIASLLAAPTLTIYRSTHAADVRIPFEIAAFMTNTLEASQRALVLAKSWENSPDVVPLEYARIASQTRSPQYVLSATDFRRETNPDSVVTANDIRYLIEFSNFKEDTQLTNWRAYLHRISSVSREVARWENARVLETGVGITK